MKTKICKLSINGNITNICEYSLEPKPALVAYLMQLHHKNYNTWTYPEIISGMYPGKVGNNWYYDTNDGGVLAAWSFE